MPSPSFGTTSSRGPSTPSSSIPFFALGHARPVTGWIPACVAVGRAPSSRWWPCWPSSSMPGFLRSPLEARLARSVGSSRHSPSRWLARARCRSLLWSARVLSNRDFSDGAFGLGPRRGMGGWCWPCWRWVLWGGVSRDLLPTVSISAALHGTFRQGLRTWRKRVATQLRSDWELESHG